MKVLVTVDLEGISDVVAIEEIFRKFPEEYAAAKRLMTMEAAALCEAILKVDGKAQIIVHDYHGDGRNIEHEQLPEPVELVRGSHDLPIDSTFDAYMLIGNHPRYGSQQGVICHTYTGNTECHLNGKPIGEFGLLAGWAGEYGVPTVLVSGDRSAVEQAVELVPTIVPVITKYGLSARSARCRNPLAVRKEFTKAVATALKKYKEIPPLVFKPPFTFSITYTRTYMADQIEWVPFLKRTGARSYQFEAQSIEQCHRMLAGIAKIQMPN